jgi:putative copper export protein
MALLLIALLLFLIMFFLGKVELYQFGPKNKNKRGENVIIVSSPKEKKRKKKH